MTRKLFLPERETHVKDEGSWLGAEQRWGRGSTGRVPCPDEREASCGKHLSQKQVISKMSSCAH